MANEIAADGPCAVTIYSGADCTGKLHIIDLGLLYDFTDAF